jgi:hypothetical protein
MVPAWAAVTIALGASAIGALAAVFGAYVSLRTAELNLQHQTAEAWRTRQLAAAEDFSVGWTAYLSCVGAVRGALQKRTDPGALLAHVNEAHAEAGAKFMRIGLLFGGNSSAREFARKAVSETNQAGHALEDLTALRDALESDREEAFAACEEHISLAQKAHHDFVRVAHSELRLAATSSPARRSRIGRMRAGRDRAPLADLSES